MDPVTYLFTPTNSKRKLSEERDDDIVVTPSSSFDETESDDSPRDSDAFLSTPCPVFKSPLKRRRTANNALHNSELSPPLMPRLSYRPSKLAAHQNERFTAGRPVLDIFEYKRSGESQQDLSFLAIPTPPSVASDEDVIPTFGLSPRTTLAPRFPELLDPFPAFPDEKEIPKSQNTLPLLKRRPINSRKHRAGRMQLIEELSLPTLSEMPERRSSFPAMAA